MIARDLNDLQPIADNIAQAIAAGMARAAAPKICRAAFRAAIQLEKKQKFTAIEAQTIIQQEIDADDALDDVAEFFCPACAWIGSQDDATFPLLRRGGPMSGPMDGATPPEHDDARCPRCECYLEARR